MSGQDPLPGLAPGRRALCRIDEIADGGARGFPGPPGSFTGLFAIRRGNQVFVYVNACPHIGTPLNLTGDRFLSRDGNRVVCVTHGAEFRIADGFCLSGPCQGEWLEAVASQIEDGTVWIPADAG